MALRSVLSCSGSSSASSFDRSGRSAPAIWAICSADVLRQAFGGLAVGAVQLAAEPLERLARVGVEIQAGADLRSRGRPRGAAQELGARVGEPSGAGDEHVATVQRGDQRLQHAERVRPAVDLVGAELGVVENERAPAAGHDLQRYRAGADAAGSAFQGPQRLKRLEYGPAGRGGVEGNGLKHRGEEAPEARVTAQQLTAERRVLAVVGVGLGGEPVHRGSGHSSSERLTWRPIAFHSSSMPPAGGSKSTSTAARRRRAARSRSGSWA